jgi:hypothetical protein
MCYLIAVCLHYYSTGKPEENPSRIFNLEVTPFKTPFYGEINGIPPRLQFLGLPVDVNSL